MKPIFYILLMILCSTYACNSDDSLPASDVELEHALAVAELENRIEQLKNEIDKTIDLSTGQTSNDCRTTAIPGGNGCGPVYVYGILGIDTLELGNLFEDLSSAQTELFNLEGGPVCDLAYPVKDSLINGSCRACYIKDGGIECL